MTGSGLMVMRQCRGSRLPLARRFRGFVMKGVSGFRDQKNALFCMTRTVLMNISKVKWYDRYGQRANKRR